MRFPRTLPSRWLCPSITAGFLAAVSSGLAAEAPVPRAVDIARTTTIPACTLFVDAAATPSGDGTREKPFATIQAAVEAAAGEAVVCVAEGTYREQVRLAARRLTLAGGFESGSGFTVRDSAMHPSKAEGDGTGAFVTVQDADQQPDATVVDGFEITGYAHGVVRDIWYSGRFDLTNNFIHHNDCNGPDTAGGGFAFANVSGTVSGNVIADNRCWRGGAGFANDALNENVLTVERNRIERNAGTQPGEAHGGAIYLFGNKLEVVGNLFVRNEVTAWGAGLYVGAYPSGGQTTVARQAWNVYIGNKAGVAGGGSFCDDSARCVSEHEIYLGNCGGNVYIDSGEIEPTVASYDHMTNVGALDVGCGAPGVGLRIDKGNDAEETYTVSNSLFWGNGEGMDFATGCGAGCDKARARVAYTMAQTVSVNSGFPIAFGDGMVAPADPLFADAAKGDLHLQSTAGRWTLDGRVKDAASSPALAKADPQAPTDGNPEQAGKRNELGAYGNSAEASYVE